MSQTHRTRRFGAALVAAATVGVALPIAGTAVSATAAGTCTAPSGLYADDALRGNVSNTTGLLDPRLSWGPVANAPSYEVEISPNEDFTNNVQDDVTTVSNRYDVPRQVLKPISYFWRVRVTGAACWSDEGSTGASEFNVGVIPAPTQLAPSDGATVGPADFRLSWTPVTEASMYDVRVLNGDNGALIGDCLTDHTTFSPDDELTDPGSEPGNCFSLSLLGVGLSYDWQVVALDGTAAQSSSKPYSNNGIAISTGAPKTRQKAPVEISSMSVSKGPDTGGTVINIVGGSFGSSANASADTATVDGVPAGFTYVDANHVTVTTTAMQNDGDTNVILNICQANCGPNQTPVFVSSVASPRSAFRVTGTADVSAPAFVPPGNVTAGWWSPLHQFTVGTPPALGGSVSSLGQVTGVAATAEDTNGNSTVSCNYPAACSDTPTISWSAVSGATSYRVTIAEGALVNGGGTNTIGTYETTALSVTPRDDLQDNQAGMAYWYLVQACTEDGCQSPSLPSAWNAFVKRSAPVVVTSPANGATVQNYNVVLTWAEWHANTGVALSPQGYEVQIASDCLFNTIMDDVQVDAPEFVNVKKTYPDGTYYWRVQPIDQSGNPLTWSTPNRDTTTCSSVPSFVLHKTIQGATGVPGAPAAGAPLVVYLDSNVKAISRTGVWAVRTAVKARNKTSLVTVGNKHQALSLKFSGTTTTVSWCNGPLNGYFNIYIDNKLKKTVNSYKAYTACGNTAKFTGLSKTSKHTIKVLATGKKGKHAAQISIDYFDYS